MCSNHIWEAKHKGTVMSNDKNIKGSFTLAIDSVILNLVEGKKSYQDILYEWDKTRGNDWFTSTQATEEYKLQKQLENIS